MFYLQFYDSKHAKFAGLEKGAEDNSFRTDGDKAHCTVTLKNCSKAPVFRGFRFSKRPSDIDLIKGAFGCIIDCVPVGLQV